MSKFKQKGFGLPGAALALGVLAYVSFQLIPIAARLQFYIFRTATVSGINELAQAGKTFYVDPDNASAWPATPQTLVAGNYLAGFENRNGYGYPYTFAVTGSSLSISTQVSDDAQANNVASHFGGLATVAGSTVTVVWSAPGNDANHQALIPRDGSRDVFGDINFRAGSGADLVLNGNNIRSTELIEAEVGSIDTLTANEFRVLR